MGVASSDGSYCCGMVGRDKKLHQLWCAKHPDRKKEEAVEAPVKSNSEQALPDAVSLAVVASLQQKPSRWKTDGKHAWCQDAGFSVAVGDGPRGVVVTLEGSGKHLTAIQQSRYEADPTASQEAIWIAFKAWQAKRMLEHVQRPDPEPYVAPWWQEYGPTLVVVGLAGVMLAVFFVLGRVTG